MPKKKNFFSFPACVFIENVVECYRITVDVNSKGLPVMKKYLLRKGFNLIEVTMAIAIVGIGIAGVMALFPPAIEANKVSDTENYLGGVADTFMNFMESRVLSDWSKVSSLEATKPDTAWNPSVTPAAISGYPGLYQYGAGNEKFFLIKSHDDRTQAFISMWSPNSAAPDFTTTSSNSRRVYMEVSWPAQVEYANRQKKLYIFDCFNWSSL